MPRKSCRATCRCLGRRCRHPFTTLPSWPESAWRPWRDRQDVRFKFDENLPGELAALFAGAGHDAVTVLDEQLGGAKAPDIAAICLSEGRVFVTLDSDFADIRAYPLQCYPGIVVFRLNRQTRDYLLEIGASLLRELSGASLQGQLWIVEDARIRIRE